MVLSGDVGVMVAATRLRLRRRRGRVRDSAENILIGVRVVIGVSGTGIIVGFSKTLFGKRGKGEMDVWIGSGGVKSDCT